MKTSSHSSRISLWLFVLIVAGSLVLTGVYTWRHTANNRNTTNADKSLLVEIKDSGSTNTKGWDLFIYTDGSGKLLGVRNYVPNTFAITPLRQSLDNTLLNTYYSCVRSASFGSVETLIYKSRTSTGIDCYISDNPTASLAEQLSAVRQKTMQQ